MSSEYIPRVGFEAEEKDGEGARERHQVGALGEYLQLLKRAFLHFAPGGGCRLRVASRFTLSTWLPSTDPEVPDPRSQLWSASDDEFVEGNDLGGGFDADRDMGKCFPLYACPYPFRYQRHAAIRILRGARCENCNLKEQFWG